MNIYNVGGLRRVIVTVVLPSRPAPVLGAILRGLADLIAEAESARNDVIQVDSFTLEEYLDSAAESPRRPLGGLSKPLRPRVPEAVE